MAKFNPRQIGKRQTLLKRMLWVLVGFVCLTLIPWGGQQLDLGATKASASQVAVGVDWGNASFPVENFQEYTSPFGYRAGGFHYGLDLAAPMGSYIRNWWSGQVVELWEDNRCGTGIIIQSGQWEHIYCHVQGHVQSNANGTYFIDRGGGLELRKGQIVPAGARIARVGMTGITTGPHLHWGLKYSNRWVDPALVLIAMYNEQNQRLSQR